MSGSTSGSHDEVNCPICSKPAERGSLYASDNGLRLRWYPGEPRFFANFVTSIGSGIPIGERSFAAGIRAEGIRCDH